MHAAAPQRPPGALTRPSFCASCATGSGTGTARGGCRPRKRRGRRQECRSAGARAAPAAKKPLPAGPAGSIARASLLDVRHGTPWVLRVGVWALDKSIDQTSQALGTPTPIAYEVSKCSNVAKCANSRILR